VLAGALVCVVAGLARWRMRQTDREQRMLAPSAYGLSSGNYSYLAGITCRNCASKLGYVVTPLGLAGLASLP